MVPRKHRVLIFGEKVIGQQQPRLTVDYCSIEVVCYPRERGSYDRLADFDLVIADYCAFVEPGVDLRRWKWFKQEDQDVFEKQMLEGLTRGAWFCFLHYDEEVPRYDERHPSGMMEEDVKMCRTVQIGFRWLERLQIRPLRSDTPILEGSVERNEFKSFLEQWGTSKNVFMPYAEGTLGDVIASLGKDFALGFAHPLKRGRILYLPCQRDYSRPNSIVRCVTTLVGNITTYLSRSRREVPPWAKDPVFAREAELCKGLSGLESKIEGVKGELELYDTAKELAFLSEYDFEDAVPEFFHSHLDIPTERDEEYQEDFWILNSESEKVVIGETKSHVRGLRKSDIYSLHNHREANGLDETFPGLLVANLNLNARSWEQKIRPIDPQNCRVAADHNILVMRIEDLLFAWNALDEGRFGKEKLLSLILAENGWLEVNIEGNARIHN